MTNQEYESMSARVDHMSRVGTAIDKAVRYLNAEFNACFYANKKTLWVSFPEAGKTQYRALGAFA